MKIFFISAILLLISQNIFSQKKLPVDSTRRIPFDANKIKDAVLLSNTSEIYSYDSLYIWNDKRSLSEIMEQRPGYFIATQGFGQRNNINYNGRDSRAIGIFRDGIQINDNFFRGFDEGNISVNEIDRIEEISNVASFFYGINSFGKSINVITKDYFSAKPFSQLRYSQDRFGSLFADVLFNEPVSRKFDVQLGIRKHSLDGRYTNSDFNIWEGRARLNFYISRKFNAKMNFYLDNFERGLNDGLVYTSNIDSLSDPDAKVIHPDSKEKMENYYFDVTLTSSLFKNPNSLTKVKLYGINSLRYLNNADTIISFKNLTSGYNHTLQYCADLRQNIFFRLSKDINSEVTFGADVYLNTNSGNYFKKYNDNYYSFFGRYDIRYKKLFASALFRNDNIRKQNFLNYGFETYFDVINNSNFNIRVNAGLNQTKYFLRNAAQLSFSDTTFLLNYKFNYYETGIKLNYKDFFFSALIYGIEPNNDTVYFQSNTSAGIISKNMDLTLSCDYSSLALIPHYYLKSNIAYKNVLFNKKLKLKVGFDLKFYKTRFITNYYQTNYIFEQTKLPFPQKNQFYADFYVGARIGHANINLTIANIFNSLVYDAYVFPFDDRSGFLNSISRFTIVWDFIN